MIVVIIFDSGIITISHDIAIVGQIHLHAVHPQWIGFNHLCFSLKASFYHEPPTRRIRLIANFPVASKRIITRSLKQVIRKRQLDRIAGNNYLLCCIITTAICHRVQFTLISAFHTLIIIIFFMRLSFEFLPAVFAGILSMCVFSDIGIGFIQIMNNTGVYMRCESMQTGPFTLKRSKSSIFKCIRIISCIYHQAIIYIYMSRFFFVSAVAYSAAS